MGNAYIEENTSCVNDGGVLEQRVEVKNQKEVVLAVKYVVGNYHYVLFEKVALVHKQGFQYVQNSLHLHNLFIEQDGRF